MRRVLLAAALLALAGCWKINVKNGAEVGRAPIEYDDKWHHGLIFGIAELSGPYDLHKVCPQGWSEVHTETDFLTGLVSGLTVQIYAPQRVTIHCAAARR